MGNTSSMLTQYDIEEVQQHCNNAFSQQEIVSLYERFCQLDRNGGGFVSGEEFLSVPEFAVNPLSQRLLRMLDGLNFKEFVAFLSAFSPRATVQQKIEFIFKVYDSDGNGKVTFNDMLDVLHDLTGQFISEQQREQVLTKVLEEAGYTKESLLVMSDFVKLHNMMHVAYLMVVRNSLVLVGSELSTPDYCKTLLSLSSQSVFEIALQVTLECST
ncbi:hypothetical protein Goarm_002178 [Gossypium armourianum]|uniref:EF-hand domain-containing protein n=1 Tax=Gossypium armourianum TaxID=34283 RepID=A0A7J9K7C1_9ROSI|nr:hypothetical protein [Gossypium armourianum]